MKSERGWGRLGMKFNSVVLGDVAEVTKLAGFEFTKYIEYNDTGEIIALRALNLRDGKLDLTDIKRIDRSVSEKLPRSKLYINDILLTYTGNGYGDCAIVEENDKYHLAPNICKIVPNTDKINPYYLYSVIRSKYFYQQMTNYIGGSSQPTIPMKTIRVLQIPYPEIAIQTRIATILQSINRKIVLNTKINENLEQQAQAIFKSWFVDFEPFGGVMPEDWNVCTLDSICNLIIKGITPKYTEDSEQLVINQKCVRNHQIDLSLARPHIPKKTNEKWLKYGDILVNSTGTGTLGRAAQVLFVPNNLTVDSHVTIIRASKAEYIHFLGLWATSHEHDFVMLQTGSTGQTDLPRERLKKMQILLPSIDILKKFSSIIKPISDTQINNHQENQRLSALRDTLLPKLMNGEIDVSQVRI